MPDKLGIIFQVEMALREVVITSNNKLDFLEVKDIWTDVEKMSRLPQFTDVTLRAGDMTIVKCHKLILATNSRVFRNMFEATDRAQDDVLDLPEMCGVSLKAMVDYMYGRRVRLTSGGSTQELLTAIDKYDIFGSEGMVREYKAYTATTQER